MIHATVAGNIGRDPEVKEAGGSTVLEFSLAASTRLRGEEHTDWVRVSVWGKRGDALSRILTKGSYVVVRGGLVCREYTGRDGDRRHSLELRADDIELGPKRASAGTDNTGTVNRNIERGGPGEFSPAPAGDTIGGGVDDDLGF